MRALVIDDSATARAVVASTLKSDPAFIVDTASSAYEARDKIVHRRPDVICLDVQMPKMDGITFLKKLMHHMPIPVVMVSSLTQSGAQTTLEALEAGAVDFVAKPTAIDKAAWGRELIDKVRSAAKARIEQPVPHPGSTFTFQGDGSGRVIAVGASTGGVDALKAFLGGLPANAPGVVIVQHMPADFTTTFARRLDTHCAIAVKEAANGDRLLPGQALLAPGDHHMVLRRRPGGYCVEVGGGAKVSGHRPSVDVLFNSVAAITADDAAGVLLTGMGADGAQGLLNLRLAGAETFGQDEASCVVYGMPRAAFERGAVMHQGTPVQLCAEVLRYFER